MTIGVSDLPPEIIEQILVECDPLDVNAFARTWRFFYEIVYEASDLHLWRSLYLAQSFDDPRGCVDHLGLPLVNFHWRRRLQHIIRARTVVSDVSKCRPDERCEILETLLDMVTCVQPAPSLLSTKISRNLLWVAALLRGGAIFDHNEWVPSQDEIQLRAQLHTYFGLAPSDARSASKVASRSFVYNMRNYKSDNDFGPFHMDASGRVNWVHLRAIHHCMSLHLVEMKEEEDFVFTIFPLSLPYCQSILPPELNLEEEGDWAGIEGEWIVSFSFCDHRELLVYNNFNLSENDPLDPSVFSDTEFIEAFRSITVSMHVLSIEPDPMHPARPKIHFAGQIEVGGDHQMVGWVCVTAEGWVRWHFLSGEEGRPIWSSEGIQIGGIRSLYGVLGSWTTVFHDMHDPIGPFWMRKSFKNESQALMEMESNFGA